MSNEIVISDGTSVIVDTDDYDRLMKRKWSANGNGYAVIGIHLGNRKYKKVYMHREIVRAADGEQVDHINGNKADNRKCNLRISTKQQNAMNIGLRQNNKSGYKGVRYEARRNKWRAEIKKDYRNVFLGYFNNKHDAAKAYNVAAVELHGEFANLNIIKEEIE